MNAPSHLALVPFVSVKYMMALVHHIGLEKFLTELAAEIEADFKRWAIFDKAPRVPSHSDVGVIELMPTSDGTTYGFKFVNGHPINSTRGLQTVTAFGALADARVLVLGTGDEAHRRDYEDIRRRFADSRFEAKYYREIFAFADGEKIALDWYEEP